MNKEYTSLGLMSGTSGDGVDASIIRSDGVSKYEVLFNKYYKYNDDIYETIHSIKEKINNTKDLKTFSKELKNLERKITMFHVEVVSEISKSFLMLIIFFFISFCFKIFLVVSLPDGSPISVVPPPNNTIG